MAQKYANYIVSEPIIVATPGVEIEFERNPIPVTQLVSSHKQVFEEMFYADAVWLWPGAIPGPVWEPEELPHVHQFEEVIAFVGSDPDNPDDLCGEVLYWLNGEKHAVTETTLIHIPAGAAHGPIIYTRIDRPVFFAVLSPSQDYGRSGVSFEEAKKLPSRGRFLTGTVKDHHNPSVCPAPNPPGAGLKCSHAAHYDPTMADTAFTVDFFWVYQGSGRAPGGERSHNGEEVIAMCVCNQADPYDIGSSKMGITLEGEHYNVSKSAMVCIPRNVKHGPWELSNVSTPTMVFTARYEGA